MDTRILVCACKNVYQDKRYGKRKRVHNPLQGKGKEGDGYRCTVCGNVRR